MPSPTLLWGGVVAAAVVVTVIVLVVVKSSGSGSGSTDTASTDRATYVAWMSDGTASLRPAAAHSNDHGSGPPTTRPLPPSLPPMVPDVANLPAERRTTFGQEVAQAARQRGLAQRAAAKVLSDGELRAALADAEHSLPTDMSGAWVTEGHALALVNGSLQDVTTDGSTFGLWVAMQAPYDDVSTFVTSVLQRALNLQPAGVWGTNHTVTFPTSS